MSDSTKTPKTIEDVYAEIKQRVVNNRKTEKEHDDLGVKLKAQARAEAYELALGLLDEPLQAFLLQKEAPPRLERTPCSVHEPGTAEVSQHGETLRTIQKALAVT